MTLTADDQCDLRAGKRPTAPSSHCGIRTDDGLPNNPCAARTHPSGHMHTTMVATTAKEQSVQPGTSAATTKSPRDTAMAPAANGYTGAMVLQAITIPDERYDSYRNTVDFINRYVFPGGFLPSLSAMSRSVRSVTDFRLVDQYDFAPDYARTLVCWKANFWDHIQQVRNLGFDDRFIRTWHYYLCYCEAGFAEQQIDVSQIMLARPQWQGDA